MFRWRAFMALALGALIVPLLPSAGAEAQTCQAIVYVDIDAAGAANGDSWTDAYPNLQDGLSEASTCAPTTTQIWVADGTYIPHPTNRAFPFDLVDDVAVYGGFDGTEAALGDRTFAAPTILSGDLLGDDNSGGTNAENSYRVVNLTYEIDAELHDLTVTAGNADGATPFDRGAGIYVESSFGMLAGATLFTFNVIVDGNEAATQGAGLLVGGSADIENSVVSNNDSALGGGAFVFGTLVFTDSTFQGNDVSSRGGALWVDANGDADLIDSLVSGNTSSNLAGGVYTANTIDIDGSTFTNNTSEGNGGGLEVANSANATVSNSLFTNNEATNGSGGGVFNTGIATVNSTTFYDNRAGVNGGAMVTDGGVGDTAIVANLIVWGNTGGTPFLNTGVGSTTSSDIEGSGGSGLTWNAALYGVDGGNNIDSDPLFTDAPAGDFTLQSISPALDTGDDSLVAVDAFDRDGDLSIVDVAPDIVGADRIQGFATDMGAYEAAGLGPIYTCGSIMGSVADFAAAGYTLTVGTPTSETIDRSAETTPQAVVGLGGDDVILGGSADDLLCGDGDNDTITALGGSDEVYGGDGNDVLIGNAGDDAIDGGDGSDTAFGGSGNDTIDGGPGDDDGVGIYLGGGSDADTVRGGEGNDRLNGGSDADILVDGEGDDDTVNGGGGNDSNVNGGPGNDRVSGNGGKDVVFGGIGDDSLFGGQNDDSLFGEAGDDVLGGNDGTDVCDGGVGDEVVGDVANASNCETITNVP